MAVFLAIFFLLQAFLGLLTAFSSFHELHEGIGTFYLVIAIVLRSNGCLSIETLFNSLTAKSVLAGQKIIPP